MQAAAGAGLARSAPSGPTGSSAPRCGRTGPTTSTTAAPPTRASTRRSSGSSATTRRTSGTTTRSSARPPSSSSRAGPARPTGTPSTPTSGSATCRPSSSSSSRSPTGTATTSTFTGGVRGTVENGKRTFYDHGRKVLDGDKYLLPVGRQQEALPLQPGRWQRAVGPSTGASLVHRLQADRQRAREDRHRTARRTAGSRWTRPPGSRTSSTRTGRPPPQDPQWGEGGPVADPGFNDARLGRLVKQRHGRRATPTTSGRNSAALSGTATASLSQRLTGLTPGTRYTASAWIEVEPGKERRTTLSAGGVVRRGRALDRQGPGRRLRPARHLLPAGQGELHRAARTAATLSDRGGGRQCGEGRRRRRTRRRERTRDQAGHGRVRGLRGRRPGLGPLPQGRRGRCHRPAHPHRAEARPVHPGGLEREAVDDVLGGDGSLKSHEENAGLVYRTAPWTVPMSERAQLPGRVRLPVEPRGRVRVGHGYDRIARRAPASVETRRTPIGQQRGHRPLHRDVTAGCGDTWTGLRKRGDAPDGADFVLDGFTVTDLGPAAEQAALRDAGRHRGSRDPGAGPEERGQGRVHQR